MFFFEGCTCPVCGELFKKDDDVVACPQCGAPHHRECYKQNSACAYESEHADGFVWSSKAPDYTENPETAENTVRCNFCLTENPSDRLFCSNCSHPLFDKSADDKNPEINIPEDNSASPVWNTNIMGTECIITDNELIDDIPIGDFKKFIRTSVHYYIPIFFYFSRYAKKISFNILAFFARGLWFISRKMYFIGGFVLALQLGIIYLQGYCTKLLEPALALYYSGGDSAALFEATNTFMFEHPVLAIALMASSALNYAIYFFCGLFSNKIYMKTCTKRIKSINSASKSAEEFNSALETQGGISIAATVIYAAVYFLLSYLIKTNFAIY